MEPPAPPGGGAAPVRGVNPSRNLFYRSLSVVRIVRAKRAVLHRRPGSLNGCPPGSGPGPPHLPPGALRASVDATRPPGPPREAALAGVGGAPPRGCCLNRAEEL